MRYLITGITGFAGPHLANLLLDDGHEVCGLIRGTNGREVDIKDVLTNAYYQEIQFLVSDLRDADRLRGLLKTEKFDGIFHLSAQSHPPTSFVNPLGTFQDNIMGSANLIEAVRELQPDCKLLFVSTSEVYGNEGQDGHKIKESDPIHPSNPYGVSKAAIDLFMQERMENKKIRGVITRAFSHTGPRRGRNFSISSDAYQLALMKRGIIDPVLMVGNLETVRVVIDVRDCMRAYYLLMKSPDTDGKAYNVCGETPLRMGFYTDELIRISGVRGVTKEVSPKLYRPIDIHYQHGDTTAIERDTGWVPTIPLEKTLTDLFEYWMKKSWAS